jgi:uncharacterized membrane protein YccC
MKQTRFNTGSLIYAIKCLLGIVICFILYISFPKYPFNWALVSVVLALSPDNNNKQAVNRMIANILGCCVGLCIYPLSLPVLALICIGASLVLAIGFALNIQFTLRSALSALVIVMLQEEKVKHWYIPLERVICVITGCVVALLLTIVFNLLPGKWTTANQAE